MIKTIKAINRFVFRGRTLDEALRYKVVIDAINRHKMSTDNILEVGSGDFGLSRYLKVKITGLDISFSKNLKSFHYIDRVVYDGLSMPFSDNSFKTVISVDSLEHISPAQREHFLKEIIRVSRDGFIILCPFGEKSYKDDIELKNFLMSKGAPMVNFLDEHIKNGVPDYSVVSEVIKKNEKEFIYISTKKILNSKIHLWYMKIGLRHEFVYKVFYQFLMFLAPIYKMINFGDCYRLLLVCKVKKYE